MLLAAMIVCTSGAAVPAAPQPSLEQAVKASFLFKFAPFIEWPSSTYGAAGKPFVICLRGEDQFGATLDETVRGQKILGRPVQVRRLGDGVGASGCHMLYAGRPLGGAYAPFADVSGQPVLTVSDQSNGVSGAMVQFVMQGGRVRFQIDNSAARANGLVISSKLLNLAVAVDGK